MATASDYTSATRGVIHICRDAEQGFRGAAKAVRDPTLKNTFEQLSEQRASFAKELVRAATTLGMDVSDATGVAGVLHAGWMELEGVLTGHSEHQILVETERGEDLSISRYKTALDANPPEGIRTILESQFAQVQESHRRIRALRDSYAEDRATMHGGGPTPAS
ncbi:MAG: PA2169 family four-helix-bundle protein [Acidobacteriia bacterium]|nr:PA2169 family four-helix-bundle protein [Terriglobia bacterium]